MSKLLSLASLATIMLTGTALAAPQVVVSTKPIHSLVSSVMGDVATPTLIVRGAGSPHTYSLRPSDAAALESADLVFWTGPGFELFLQDALKTLSTKAEIVSFADTPDLVLLDLREGGAFEAHDHGDEGDHDHDHEGHDHEGHDHGHDDHAHGDEGDLHFWLNPANAGLMVTYIEDVLTNADPDNGPSYAANAEATRAAIVSLETELSAQLSPVADKPFVVFHDAYQYFERAFGLTVAGTITVSPDVAPGAGRIDELRAKVADLGATCIFAEPNFEPAVVRVISEGTEAKSGVLDPEGASLTEGPELYGQLMRNLAQSLTDCLN
jgi:zinc transport system substrate-binding protein